MLPAWIVESVYVFEDCQFRGAARVPRVPPDQFGLDGLEERLDNRVIVAVAFTAHGYLESMLAQTFLVIVRAILGTSIRVMDAALGRLSQGDSHVQRADRQVPFHPVADSPANDPTRIQIQNHSQIQPALLGPDKADINNPFLIGRCSRKVAVQQVRCNIELVIAVRGDLVFAGSDNGDSVLTHQPANTAVADIKAQLLQFLRHSWPPIAAQGQAVLFSDVRQQNHILTLAPADRARPESAKTTCADIHDPAQSLRWHRAAIFFNEPEPHGL